MNNKILELDNIYESNKLWKDKKERLISDSELFYIKIEDLHKLRKKKRNRRNSIRGAVDLEYKSMGRDKRIFKRNNPDKVLDGPEKWDKLVESMEKLGWVDTNPALIQVSNNRDQPKLRDGHHRLAIARELGIEVCPVKIYYVWRKR